MARFLWPALLCVITLSVPLQADVIALKRDAGLSFAGDTLTDVRFAAATVVATTTADTGMFTANPGSIADWHNWGASASLTVGLQLYRFDLSPAPALSGAVISLAQLRLRNLSGNTGGAIGRVTTHDWIEGTKVADFPGTDGGASWAHPRGYNTGSYQDPSGGTTPPLTTWGPLSDRRFSTTADGDMERPANPGTTPGADWQVFDVTDIVATWTQSPSPDPNFGLYLLPGNYARETSEAGWDVQPVLFIDYVPEPAALVLMAIGALAVTRRRG